MVLLSVLKLRIGEDGETTAAGDIAMRALQILDALKPDHHDVLRLAQLAVAAYHEAQANYVCRLVIIILDDYITPPCRLKHSPSLERG